MKKRILVGLLVVFLVVSGCIKVITSGFLDSPHIKYKVLNSLNIKYETLSFSKIEKMFIENRELFSEVAKECIEITEWSFSYENGKVEVHELYPDEGDTSKYVLSDELNEKLLKCFSAMEKTVELERDKKDFSFSIDKDVRFGYEKVTFCFYDNQCKYGIDLCYSKSDMREMGNVEKISDDWYLWGWGSV